jgi:hypothetical protein
MITQFRQAMSAQIGNVSSRLDSIGSGTLGEYRSDSPGGDQANVSARAK